MASALVSQHMHEFLSVVACKPNDQLNPGVCGHNKSVALWPVHPQNASACRGGSGVRAPALSCLASAAIAAMTPTLQTWTSSAHMLWTWAMPGSILHIVCAAASAKMSLQNVAW